MVVGLKRMPVNSFAFITVMNLFPLVGVMLGELDYLSLIILYLIDTILIVFFNFFRMFKTDVNYSLDYDLYKQDTITKKETGRYRFEVYMDYFLGHIFILGVLTAFMLIPAAVANPRGEDFAADSITRLFYQRWFQWAMILNFVFHLGSLFYFYKGGVYEKYTVEYLARVDTRKYFLLFLLMFCGTIIAGPAIKLSHDIFTGVLIYSILLTAGKIYIDFRDYNAMIQFEGSE